MSILVADCPRCSAKRMTFEVKAQAYRQNEGFEQQWHEVFCVCGGCTASVTFVLVLNNLEAGPVFYKSDHSLVSFSGSLNQHFRINRYISLRDNTVIPPPKHLPDNVESVFSEGAACLGVGCYNASATMFRLCVDLATESLLPNPKDQTSCQPNGRQKEKLYDRIKWLFDNKRLPANLHDLADCIREDGNDGAHLGKISRQDAEDLLEFTMSLLEQLYTVPRKVELAKERKIARRA